MALERWVQISPMSGSQDATINITAAAHTGRLPRSEQVLVTAANGTKPSQTIALTQEALAITSSIEATKPDIPKTGGTFTVSGKSNSQKLAVYIGACLPKASLLFPYCKGLAVTIAINGGTAVPVKLVVGDNPNYSGLELIVPVGDPGATNTYSYVLNITFGESTFPVDIPYKIRLADDRSDLVTKYGTAGATTEINKVGTIPTGVVECNTKLLAGASRLAVSKTALAFTQSGGTHAVEVQSNDDWSIS